jgi:hypothetical protein
MNRNYSAELRNLFIEQKVLDIGSIVQSFPERSRTSLTRDLQSINAIACYNGYGNRYTLKEIAEFNEHGIWECKDALFSVNGSFKSTIISIVNNSFSGMTQRELKEILILRVSSALSELTGDNQIAHEVVHNQYLYVSADTNVSQMQIEARLNPQSKTVKLKDNPLLIMEIYKYVIECNVIKTTAADIYNRFKDRGLSMRACEEIHKEYIQGKKN